MLNLSFTGSYNYLIEMLGENKPPGKVDLSVTMQKRLVVGISVHGLFSKRNGYPC